MADGFERWVDGVFGGEGRGEPEPSPRGTVQYLTRLFQGPEVLIGRYSADEIGDGIWYLVDASSSNHAFALRDDSVPWEARHACLAAIATLYEHLFARICEPRLGHLEKPGGRRPSSKANGICYMFWDVLPIGPDPEHGNARARDEVCLEAMARTLAIPHLACQEGALHGLGHWQRAHPERVASIVDGARIPHALRAYAACARGGRVQ